MRQDEPMFVNEESDQIDKRIKQTHRLIVSGLVVSLIVSLVAFGGLCWVIFKLLAYFGVV